MKEKLDGFIVKFYDYLLILPLTIFFVVCHVEGDVVGWLLDLFLIIVSASLFTISIIYVKKKMILEKNIFFPLIITFIIDFIKFR